MDACTISKAQVLKSQAFSRIQDPSKPWHTFPAHSLLNNCKTIPSHQVITPLAKPSESRTKGQMVPRDKWFRSRKLFDVPKSLVKAALHNAIKPSQQT